MPACTVTSLPSHREDLVHRVERQEVAIGHGDIGERVAAADDLDALAGGSRRPHDRRHLVGESRFVHVRRDASLIAGPVLRRNSHA